MYQDKRKQPQKNEFVKRGTLDIPEIITDDLGFYLLMGVHATDNPPAPKLLHAEYAEQYARAFPSSLRQ